MIKDKVVSSIDELMTTFHRFNNGYMYRGHAEASWRLQSTLERLAGPAADENFVDRWEQYSLSVFKAKFHIYDTQNERPESKLEWLSLMQHYGVPTRLLDFTASPYVALYFAIERYDPSSKKDFAVYAIDYDAMMDVSVKEIKKLDRSFQYDNEKMSLDGKQDEVFEQTMDRFALEILWVTEPAKLNVRIDRQSGCFLLTGKKSLSVESAIAHAIYDGVDVAKVIIPAGLFEGVYALLRKMNISATTIYGDLAGLSGTLQAEARLRAYLSRRSVT